MAVIDNLVSYWALDEASGQRDDSHGTNHMTEAGTVGTNTGKVYALAAALTGSNGFYLGDNASVSVSGATIEYMIAAWVKLGSKTTTQKIVSKGSDPNESYFLEYSLGADRFLFGTYEGSGQTGGDTVSADALGSPSIGTWYLVIAWRDSGGTLHIQVNDGTVNNSSGANSTGYDEGGEFDMGFTDGLGDNLTADLGPIAFFKGGLLDATQRTWLWNSGDGRTYQDIVDEGGAAPLALVQKDEGYAITGSVNPQMATPFTNGNTLAMLIVRTGGSGTFSLSEPLYNGTIPIEAISADENVILFVLRNITGGFDTVNITCSDQSTTYIMEWYELENVDPTSTIESSENSEASATSHVLAGTGITGTGFYIGGARFDQNAVVTPAGGWTGFPTPVSWIASLQYKIQTATDDGAFTTNVAVTTSSLLALIPESGSGGGGTPTVTFPTITATSQVHAPEKVSHTTFMTHRQRLVRR